MLVEFDYVIINDDFEEARTRSAAVVRAARLSLARQMRSPPRSSFDELQVIEA